MGNPIDSNAGLVFALLLCTIALTNSAPTTGETVQQQVLKVPATAAKAGGRLRPEFLAGKVESEKVIEIPLVPLDEMEEDFDYEDVVSDENTCEEGMYWHIRGGQCVPERCPNGRDRMTGACLALEAAYYRGGAYYGGGLRGGGGRGSSWISTKNAMRGIGRWAGRRRG